MSKIVYIASPYAGDVENNTAFAVAACRCCIARGYTPIAPHLLYTRMLDDGDPAERKLGPELGRSLLRAADEMWVCGERVSSGMEAEIAEAKRLGVPARYVGTRAICEGTLPINEPDMAVGQAAGREMSMG